MFCVTLLLHAVTNTFTLSVTATKFVVMHLPGFQFVNGITKKIMDEFARNVGNGQIWTRYELRAVHIVRIRFTHVSAQQ